MTTRHPASGTDRNVRRRVVVSRAVDVPNPYGRLLAQAVEEADPTFRVRAPRVADLLRPSAPDLWHIHWPDSPATRRNPVRAAGEVTALVANVWVAKRRGIPIIWTVHNTEARETRRPWLARRLLRWVAESVDGWISLSVAGVREAETHFPVLLDRSHTVVPHGHYSLWYASPPNRVETREALGIAPEDKVLLCLGHIRPHKNVPELIQAFAGTEDDTLRLIIAGQCQPRVLKPVIRDLADVDRRVTLRLGHIPDAEIPRLLAAADGFVVPAERLMNSGSAVLALSCGVPVLVTNSPVMRELQTTFGHPAVQLLDGPVTARALEDFSVSLDVDRSRVARETRAAYDWDRIGQATAAFYRRILESAQIRRDR